MNPELMRTKTPHEDMFRWMAERIWLEQSLMDGIRPSAPKRLSEEAILDLFLDYAGGYEDHLKSLPPIPENPED